MKNKKRLICFAFIIIIVMLFNGCKKNDKINNVNNKQSQKQDNNVKSTDVRTFTKEPLIYNNKSIPVLMYHSIDYEEGNELRVPKEL